MERGSFYQDEDGKLYQITELATMNGNGEPLVVYQELFGDFARKAELLENFESNLGLKALVQQQGQKPEREILEGGSHAEEADGSREREPHGFERSAGETARDGASRRLMQFLDAPTSAEKLEILYDMKDEINDYVVDAMIVSLDFDIPEGLVEDRYQKLIRSLQTKMRYESTRLR